MNTLKKNDYSSRLSAIRKNEGLTQAALSQLSNVSIAGIKNYESGQASVGLSVITRILAVPQFAKYAAWLMTGQTDIKQVAPDPEFLDANSKRRKTSS